MGLAEICILSVLCLTEIFAVFANSVWQPFLLTDHDKISNLYRVPSIYVSYKVLVHLAKQFQRRRFLEIDELETRIACGGL